MTGTAARRLRQFVRALSRVAVVTTVRNLPARGGYEGRKGWKA